MREQDVPVLEGFDDDGCGEPVLMTWEEPRTIIRRQIRRQFQKTLLMLITHRRIYIVAAAFFIACWYFYPAGGIDIGDQKIPRWLAFLFFALMILLQVAFFGLVALLVTAASRAGDNTVEIKKTGLWYSGICVPFRSLKTVNLDQEKIRDEIVPVLVLVDHQNDVRERIGISATVDIQKLKDLLAERIRESRRKKETV